MKSKCHFSTPTHSSLETGYPLLIGFVARGLEHREGLLAEEARASLLVETIVLSVLHGKLVVLLVPKWLVVAAIVHLVAIEESMNWLLLENLCT